MPPPGDKTGIVIEVRPFHQYVVRVDGSGRVTLRNRRFLRKYTPAVERRPVTSLPSLPRMPASYPPPATLQPVASPPTVPPAGQRGSPGTSPSPGASPSPERVVKHVAEVEMPTSPALNPAIGTGN